MRTLLIVVGLMVVLTALHSVQALQQTCPPWISQIAQPGVTCRLMTPGEQDDMNDGMSALYEDDLDNTFNSTSIMNHGTDWVYGNVWVISNGNLLNASGQSSPYVYAATGSGGERVIRSDKVSIMWGTILFHEGPHLHWHGVGEDEDAHDWWDSINGYGSWNDYCRDPSDFANPGYAVRSTGLGLLRGRAS